MRLDELVDKLVQPQQDQKIAIELEGQLFELELNQDHPSGYFVLKCGEAIC